jgi:hypothetical protein
MDGLALRMGTLCQAEMTIFSQVSQFYYLKPQKLWTDENARWPLNEMLRREVSSPGQTAMSQLVSKGR